MDGQIYGMLLWIWLLTLPLVIGFIDLMRTPSASPRAFDHSAGRATEPRTRG
ncbi:hypothetical protein [Methylocapsa palsarum]|uniref:Uncharacterized protein n=1 Tax=Methylocapsa palsarum TaxID=1612308 RepID=A0A1I3YWI9_9HYPH|nr:hypothetical protein [Methylocapsa palsarum]SFK35581.1 hypothetical protein SAMN05444581_106199 [Methylocapsa palsarum]